jgi:hypothetical protein
LSERVRSRLGRNPLPSGGIADSQSSKSSSPGRGLRRAAGLTLIAVWEEWEEAQVTADDEASEVAEVFWTAHTLPQPQGRHIQELAPTHR